MVWAKERDRPTRYLISVGRDKLRAKTLLDLWDICDVEGSTMADEVWDALFTHVERYGKSRDSGDGRGLMHLKAEELDDELDDVIANESFAAQEEAIEEVLDAERRVEQRMATSNMFRNSENGI
tara:strand:- start:653 stop:1024 length:372 start_codon:yes stop_codon:yes gene_type:complete